MRQDSTAYKFLVRSYQRICRRMWWFNYMARNGIRPLQQVVAKAQEAVAKATGTLGEVAERSGVRPQLLDKWTLQSLEKRVLLSLTPSLSGQTVTFNESGGSSDLYLRGTGGGLED